MNSNCPHQEHIENTETDMGYKVFYSDSEDMAKLLAISHIQSSMHRDNYSVERPNIKFKSWLFGAILPGVFYLLITVAMILLDTIGAWVFVFAYLVVFLLTIKSFVILFVLIYQKCAPERIRCSCRFEPSCSNYMLQAIEKYGFWKGFAKGVRRLFRCRYPNGGIDFP